MQNKDARRFSVTSRRAQKRHACGIRYTRARRCAWSTGIHNGDGRRQRAPRTRHSLKRRCWRTRAIERRAATPLAAHSTDAALRTRRTLARPERRRLVASSRRAAPLRGGSGRQRSSAPTARATTSRCNRAAARRRRHRRRRRHNATALPRRRLVHTPLNNNKSARARARRWPSRASHTTSHATLINARTRAAIARTRSRVHPRHSAATAPKTSDGAADVDASGDI